MPKKIVAVKDLPRGEWLKIRRGYIGGSDAGAILGLNPYNSPYSVWADKRGLLPEQEDNEALKSGRELEAYGAQRFTERSGKRVRRAPYMIGHEVYEFMAVNLDREVIGESAFVEVKTTSALNQKKFTHGVFPEMYYAQCLHGLTVTGYPRAYLAVLVLNRAFHVYMMTRIKDDVTPEWCDGAVYVEQAEIDALIGAEREFWAMVEDNIPPPIDGSDATKTALNAVHPTDDNAPVALLYGKEELIHELDRLKVQKLKVDTAINTINNSLRQMLGNASTGLMHGYELRMQTIIKAAYTVTPKPYTVLRIKTTEE